MISIKYQIQRIKYLLRSVRLMEKIFASLGNIFAFILPSGIFANFLWWVILVIFALEYFMKWYLLGGFTLLFIAALAFVLVHCFIPSFIAQAAFWLVISRALLLILRFIPCFTFSFILRTTLIFILSFVTCKERKKVQVSLVKVECQSKWP